MITAKKSNTITRNEVEEWETVWVQAVALAWKDDTFAAKLTASPSSARDALFARFNYSVPEGVEMHIVKLTEEHVNAGSFEWQASGTSSVTKGVVRVVLPLPAKPTDSSAHATSLAELVSTMRHRGCAGACF